MRHGRDADAPWLFAEPTGFEGLPEEGFRVFALAGRDARRRAILEAFHPPLTRLGEHLLRHLNPRTSHPLHAHLPRLDWPPGYQPFCTWLALSRAAHGYQAGTQLNVGVHADHVALRLGWDTSAAAFGRFEFLSRFGALREPLLETARAAGLRFRVYAAADWPAGSRLVADTPDDLDATFDEVRRRGVWWELGRRLDLPGALPVIASAELGRVALDTLAELLPLYDRIEGEGSCP